MTAPSFGAGDYLPGILSHRIAKALTAALHEDEPIVLPTPEGNGLFMIEAQLLEGDRVRAIYHSAFWIRDEAYLRSGPRLAVNHNYFELDGHPLAVVGTTYMSSEVQTTLFRASECVCVESRTWVKSTTPD